MAKLFGTIAALTVAGVEIPKGKDGSFEVPDDQVGELKAAFGLRDTEKEPEPAPEDVPAEIHEAMVDEAKKVINDLTGEAQEARRGRGEALAQLDAVKDQLKAVISERDGLAGQVDGLKAEQAAVTAARDALSVQVEDLKSQLAEAQKAAKKK